MISLVSYPERGEGGKNTYRGNCSPKLIRDLCKQYKLEALSDTAVGSGTTRDVVNNLGLRGDFWDLNEGFDILNDEIPKRMENVFYHPVYWDIIRYAGFEYDAKSVDKKYSIHCMESDMSRPQPYENFIKELNYAVMKQFTALEKGGYFFILMGDIRKKGRYYSMLCDIVKPGKFVGRILKVQHNCMSYGTKYASANFVPIVHEDLLVLQKENSLLYSIGYGGHGEQDIRDMVNATWRDILASILEASKKPLTLEEFYQQMDGHKKCESNTFWKEKIRQILRTYDCFTCVNRGTYALTSAA